jgi:hypothetical protein
MRGADDRGLGYDERGDLNAGSSRAEVFGVWSLGRASTSALLVRIKRDANQC